MSVAPHRFEGSFMGDASRINDDAVLECKICWYSYDPAEGDEIRQIPPVTPFSRLPLDWRCPHCDGERSQFMVVQEGTVAPPVDPVAIAVTVGKRLADDFRRVHLNKMNGVPMNNRSLSVEAVGFRPFGTRVLGMLITPWCMNLVVLPGEADDWSTLRIGEKRCFVFPSGEYEFLRGQRDMTGPYFACSLFSPMDEFSSQLQATDVARAALAALFDEVNREDTDGADEIRARREAELAAVSEPEPEVAGAISTEVVEPKRTVLPSRRDFLTGGKARVPSQDGAG